MSKPKGRLLLTWNEKKHPEIVQFFDSIEQGLYSHHVREAIKFYMKHNKGNDSTGDYKNSLQVESVNVNSDGNDDYVSFDPDDI